MKMVYLVRWSFHEEFDGDVQKMSEGLLLAVEWAVLQAHIDTHHTVGGQFSWVCAKPEAMLVEEALWARLVHDQGSSLVRLDALPDGFSPAPER